MLSIATFWVFFLEFHEEFLNRLYQKETFKLQAVLMVKLHVPPFDCATGHVNSLAITPKEKIS